MPSLVVCPLTWHVPGHPGHLRAAGQPRLVQRAVLWLYAP
jgi:hypothetical protein